MSQKSAAWNLALQFFPAVGLVFVVLVPTLYADAVLFCERCPLHDWLVSLSRSEGVALSTRSLCLLGQQTHVPLESPRVPCRVRAHDVWHRWKRSLCRRLAFAMSAAQLRLHRTAASQRRIGWGMIGAAAAGEPQHVRRRYEEPVMIGRIGVVLLASVVGLLVYFIALPFFLSFFARILGMAAGMGIFAAAEHFGLLPDPFQPNLRSYFEESRQATTTEPEPQDVNAASKKARPGP